MAPKFYEAPKFYPTHRDMAGPFEKYIESIEEELAEFGLGIIIPPRGWKPTSAKYDTMNFEVSKPIRQHVTGSKGIYQSVHVEQKGLSLQEFKAMATAKENLAPIQVDTLGPEHDDLERHFWKNLTHFPPLYGADSEGSLFDPDHKGWNIRDLDTCLSKTLKEHGATLPGVTTPYLYVGMWRSMFAWHTEDVDLYSVNYLHFGEPKSWYCIPPALRGRFERVVQGLAPEFHRNCPEFLRHKETLVTPFIIQQHNIPLVKAVQTPGQWVINFPSAYHSGFNHGFNCAESTNFATQKWVEYGAKAKACRCSGESVRIDMRLFGVEPPPVKLKPGAVLLAPPLPLPDLPGVAVTLAPQGKMVRRKALSLDGALGTSPVKHAKVSPSKASAQTPPGMEVTSSGKKRKAASETKKGSHKGLQGAVASELGDPPVLLAPGLELLPMVPVPKKRKPAQKKKGAQGAVAALQLAPPLGVFTPGLSPAGAVVAAKKSPKRSKQKAPKVTTPKAGKAKATGVATALPGALPLAVGATVAAVLGGNGVAPETKAGKGGAKRRKGKLAVAESPVLVASLPPVAGTVAGVQMAAGLAAPANAQAPSKSKKKKAKPVKAGGLIEGALQPPATDGSNAQPEGAEAVQKPKTPKILRIKFNPPAALGMAAGSVAKSGEKRPSMTKAAAAKPQAGMSGAVQLITQPQEGVDPGGGAKSPLANTPPKAATPLAVEGTSGSPGTGDRVRTRRGGALPDEPLALLFKDPPTGTKVQGRKRVREGDEAPGVEAGMKLAKKDGNRVGPKKKKTKAGKKDAGGAVAAAHVGGLGAISAVASLPESAAAVGVLGVEPAGTHAEAPVGVAQPAADAPTLGDPTVGIGMLPVAEVPGHSGGTNISPSLEQPVSTFPAVETGLAGGEERLIAEGGTHGMGPELLVEARSLLIPTKTVLVPEPATVIGPVAETSVVEEASPLNPSAPAAAGGVGEGAPGGQGDSVGGLAAPWAGVLGAGQGLLPTLVSPLYKQSKKKGKGRKGASKAPGSVQPLALGEGGPVAKPRVRRRGPPPVERPPTHQMQRRSTRQGGPVEEIPATVTVVPAIDTTEIKSGLVAGVIETGVGESGVVEGPRETVALLPVAEANGSVGKLPEEWIGTTLEGVEVLAGPAERLKGGAAMEPSEGGGATSGDPSPTKGARLARRKAAGSCG